MSIRGNKLAKELGTFLKQYARKSCPHIDPNDRRYDRRIEAIVRRMSPEELDRLIREELLDDSPRKHRGA